MTRKSKFETFLERHWLSLIKAVLVALAAVSLYFAPAQTALGLFVLTGIACVVGGLSAMTQDKPLSGCLLVIFGLGLFAILCAGMYVGMYHFR